MKLLAPLLLLSLAPTAPALSADPPRRKDYVAERTALLSPDRVLVYKRIDDRALEFRVFLPEGWAPSDRRSCFLLFHGGGWSGMDPSRMYPFAADFAKRHGMVGISAQYRLLRPGKTSVFDCVKDARSAVRQARSRAAELGIDPAKLVVGGASAGGHLAAATALFDGIDEDGEDLGISCRPDAMVLWFPVIDTSAEGYGNPKIGDRWKELSPLHRVQPGLSPTLLFHGTGDTVTPFAGARAFHEAMLAAGNASELEVREGARHGYLMFEEPLYEDAVAKTAAFLGRLGLVASDAP